MLLKQFLLILFNSNQVRNSFKSINTDNIYPIFYILYHPASKQSSRAPKLKFPGEGGGADMITCFEGRIITGYYENKIKAQEQLI